MEGIGSRFGRVSSRYGSIAGPSPVFNGPVRKWKRKWVRSEPKDISGAGSRGGNRRRHQQEENKPSLLLCRWTHSDDPPEPTRRKFRYTPVVALEEKKKEAVGKLNTEAEAMEVKQSKLLTANDDMLIGTPDDDDDDSSDLGGNEGTW